MAQGFEASTSQLARRQVAHAYGRGMLYNNMNHVEERHFVHSSFYYQKQGGSQFLADRLSNGLDIRYDTAIGHIKECHHGVQVNDEHFDRVVFCGNIKDPPRMVSIPSFETAIEQLEVHGTTSVFCEIDKNEYSWMYMSSRENEVHRIICTGNFAEQQCRGKNDRNSRIHRLYQ